MNKIRELIDQGRGEELWQMCCGFLDLNIDQFMAIQRQLLLEQIELLGKSRLGRKIMHGAMPGTIEEFRAQVPLTTYKDYCPELLDKREDILPSKPVLWIQTSGRSGEYSCKWIPVSQRFWEEASLNFCAVSIFGACKGKGDMPLKDGLKLLHAAALPPFLTGHIATKIGEDIGFRFLPPLDDAGNMSFEERVNKGFNLALSSGMDGFFGLGGILVAIGEKFRQGSGNSRISRYLLHPEILFRLAKGAIKSKLAKRHILPSDLWTLKVIVSVGTDSSIYKDKIKKLWGRNPLDVYGNSETTVIATQIWDYNDMVFFPNLNFLEFIPENEYFKWQINPDYQPKSVLLNEVEAGQNYELVITNFHGGAMVRYRIGDMVRIKSLKNEKLGVSLPQMAFERRADDLIDLGFMRLTEKVISKAIENAKIPHRGWTARKELGGTSRLHLYLEPDNGYLGTAQDTAEMVYEQIKRLDDGLYVYKDLPSLEKLLDFKPIVVSLLPEGAFSRYKNYMRARGASFTHLRPPHINPADTVLSLLQTKDEAAFRVKVMVRS